MVTMTVTMMGQMTVMMMTQMAVIPMIKMVIALVTMMIRMTLVSDHDDEDYVNRLH